MQNTSLGSSRRLCNSRLSYTSRQYLYTATALIESLQASDQLVVHALSSPSGPPLITNLINVGVLATKLGIGLGYYGDDLHRLALAGLVHDIGIFAISQNVLTKTGRLTSDERVLIEQHPRLGYESIRQLGESYEWLAEVVLQAHERGMGQGYPNKLKGRQISELAQIIGAVDIFDALISPRPYRRRLLPHEAVRELLVNERTAFPREVMKALVEQLSVYPLGTKVRLSSGEEGMVIRINPRYPSRPVVKIEQADGSSIPSRNVDLSTMPMVSVTDTIDPPAVDRIDFFKAEEPAFTTASSVNASDQFAVLLESLDAIASVIQTVVKKKEGSGELGMASTCPAGPASDGATTTTLERRRRSSKGSDRAVRTGSARMAQSDTNRPCRTRTGLGKTPSIEAPQYHASRNDQPREIGCCGAIAGD